MYSWNTEIEYNNNYASIPNQHRNQGHINLIGFYTIIRSSSALPWASHEPPSQSFHLFSFSNYGHLCGNTVKPSDQKGTMNHLKKGPYKPIKLNRAWVSRRVGCPWKLSSLQTNIMKKVKGTQNIMLIAQDDGT